MGFVTEFAFKFFPEEEFESVKGLPPDRRIAASVRNCLRLLMIGYTPKWRELITPEVFRAVFIERSPQFIKWMRQEFQYGFNFLLEQLQSLVFIEDHHFEQIHLYISNCLSYFPFADPNPYESITIPQRVGRLWQGIEYKIKPIELTSGIHHEADRVFAYGLEPLFVKEAESHLIFMGTTYPAGQGFLTQIRNNFKGFESVGKDLYRTGRNSIHAWLERQTGAVHVCGTSLGGALGLLLAIDEGNYRLSRVDVLNPPGLHDAKNKSQFDHWEILARKPQVVIQLQGDDPVSTFGVWKPDWKLLRIMPPHDKRGPNGFWDHALNYAGIKGTEVRELDPVVENGLRKRRNFWLFSLGRRVIYHLLQIYAFIVRPVQNFIMNYAQELMIFTLGASIFILTGFSVLVGMLTLLAIAGSLMEKSPTSSIKIGDPYLPRNESLDLYNPKNTQEFCFSYQEIHSYFLLMRCLLKNKELTPHRDGFLWQTQLSKKQLLEQSLIPENAERKVNIRLSKAKAFMIFKVLELPSKSKQNVLSTAIDEIYQEYKSGKIN